MMSEDDDKVIDDLGPEQAVPREKVMFESSTSQKEFDEEEFPDTSFDVVDEEENETNKKDPITTTEAAVDVSSPPKDFFVSFENLTVHVPGRRKGCCASEHNPLWNFARENLNVATEDRDPLYALNDVSGYLKAGEMCLVLGSEDLPVTTLLRTLCGRLNKTDDVSGTIFLNGIPLGQHSTNQQGWRRLSPYVSETDASHSPVLTVKETFEFAAQCTNGNTTPDEVDELVQRMLEILDLSHVQDTVVGDENLRGISGGQKRRVTVGEMMFDLQSKFFCLEHITDGLASTDSKTLIQNLSHYCHTKGVCGFISLLQPSDDIVETFDKLCVLTNDGGLAYYGPTERYLLRSIFLEPTQRNTIVDSGSIADLVLRNTCDSMGSQNVQERFYQSELGSVLTKTLSEYRSKAPPASQRGTALEEYLPSTKYNTSRWYQAQIIAKRRLKLIQRNAVTYMRIGVAIFFGIVIGSLFSALGPNIMGALGRTGYMFLNAFLVLMLSSAVTIPASFRERVTLFKHRRAEFFSGRVAYVTQIVLDAPLSILEAILLAAIGYYWVGMNPRVANFFFFMGCLIGLEFVGQAFGRLLCSLIQKEVSANAASSVCILIFATVGGFMPSFTQIPTIFKWLSWVTPVSYAFEAMMINEFHGTTVDVFSLGDSGDGSSSLIETSGDNWLKGFGIPRASWTATVTGNKIFNICMLFFFATLYDVLGAYYIEYNREYYDQPLRRPQRKVAPKKKKNTKKQEEELIEEGEADVTTGTTGKKLPSCLKSSSSSPLSASNGPQTLAIHNICYEVPLKKEKVSSSDDEENEKGQSFFKKVSNRLCSKKSNDHLRFENEKSPKTIRLLNNVNAVFERGHMVALMGSSGAGKTTLLDVIAGYKTGGSISGDIMVDGVLQTNVPWKQMTGYAEQNDILNPFLSVRETIRFTAVCKLPRSTSSKELNDAINRVVELVSLEPWLDMIVGHEREGEGLSKHARKRLTIALQLVIQPKILFLDEPTSGLGTIDSKLVMDAIRRSTDELGLITIATIHQPSQRIWDSFDDVLLLAKGGKLAYFGPRGTMGSNIVLDYFETLYQTQRNKMLQSSSMSMEKTKKNNDDDEEALSREEIELNRQTCNPADYVIQALTSIDATQVEEEFHGSELYQNLMMKLNTITSTSNNNEQEQDDIEEKTTKKGTKLQDTKKNKQTQATVNKPLTEFWLLTKRQFIVQWRNPSYCFMRLLSSCVLSLYMGILFVGNKQTLEGAVFSIGSIFFLVFVLVIPMQASVVPLVEDRAVLYRETVSGTYSRLSYGLGQLVADIPFHLVNALIMFVCFYFIAGFRRNVGEGHMGYFLLMIIMANWVIMSVGQLYSLVTPNEESANGLAGLTVMLSVILMGFLITVDSMPSGWTWAYWCNLFRYILQGLVTNELGGNTYHIDIGGMLFGNGNDNTNSTRKLLQEGTVTNQTIVAVKGNDQVDQGIVNQITNLMGLVGSGRTGEEDEEGDAFAGSEEDSTSISRLSDWLQCNIENECFVDPIMTNVMDCNVFQLFGTPPCKDEFNAAQQDLTKVSACFVKHGDFSGTTTTGTTTDDGNLSDALGSARNDMGIANGVPSDFTIDKFQQLSNQTQVQLVVCLIDALVPQNTVKTLQRVTIKLFDIVGVVIDVINNGIDLPGDLILWFFGWATVDNTTGDIVAPFKWWYCMGSVAIFLVAIEVFKLIAIRFIVWTKR